MKKTIFILLMVVAAIMPFGAKASGGEEGGQIDYKGIIFEHLGDTYGWDVPFCHGVRIPLPVIVKDNAGSWHVFSSAHLMHGGKYEGFEIPEEGEYKGKVVQLLPNGEQFRPTDISITKNVAALFISMLVVLWMVFAVKKWYKRNGMKAPRKGTAALEVCVEFVYNGVIRPTLGEDAKRFGPYLLTAFFFVLTMNLLGLMVIFPGGANLTGNIAVTMVMAIFTFALTNLFGTKHYWKEIFWPEVPLWLKFPLPIMPVIEVFGMFTKPAALTVRLFANMIGGHMIIIVLTLLIFIFGGLFGVGAAAGTTVLSLLFSVFMLLLDTLVSFIQAFVFTMLSTLFIALARERGHHAHE